MASISDEARSRRLSIAAVLASLGPYLFFGAYRGVLWYVEAAHGPPAARQLPGQYPALYLLPLAGCLCWVVAAVITGHSLRHSRGKSICAWFAAALVVVPLWPFIQTWHRFLSRP